MMPTFYGPRSPSGSSVFARGGPATTLGNQNKPIGSIPLEPDTVLPLVVEVEGYDIAGPPGAIVARFRGVVTFRRVATDPPEQIGSTTFEALHRATGFNGTSASFTPLEDGYDVNAHGINGHNIRWYFTAKREGKDQ